MGWHNRALGQHEIVGKGTGVVGCGSGRGGGAAAESLRHENSTVNDLLVRLKTEECSKLANLLKNSYPASDGAPGSRVSWICLTLMSGIREDAFDFMRAP